MAKTKLRAIDIILLVVCIVLMFFSYQNIRKRKRINEVKDLPYKNVSLENVQDGIYTAKTETSFLNLKLQVKVENHKIEDIKVLERSEIRNFDEKVLLDKMIAENKAFVEVVKGQELASLVYITCLDSALAQGDSSLQKIEDDTELSANEN
ncbi:MAG: hypothetical protein K5866_03155 [Treponema sp.]|nr:hypothetical protein [Treponema sp.]